MRTAPSTTLNGLALATLVNARTDSPLLAALSMFGPSFAELVGATTLLSVADRVRPAVASIGFASTLLLQERLIALIGEDVRGQALGLHVGGMKAMQAVGATLAGLTAQYLPVGTATTVMAAASLAVTAALSPGLRLSEPRPAVAR